MKQDAIGDDVLPQLHALEQLLESFEADASLFQADRLTQRFRVLDALDAHFAGAEVASLASTDEAALCGRAGELAARLEAVNGAVYDNIRKELQRGHGPSALLRYVSDITAPGDGCGPIAGFGFDALDELIRGVLGFDEPASPQLLSHAEMVFYQPTPARHIFDLLELAPLSEGDVLVDLGSGLGHVTLLVAMCAAAKSVGVELEASYVACARRCAHDLHLDRATFVQQDARTADLSAGTVFYLHTPFTGTIMRSVLDRLKAEAENRSIHICTYGPCTAVVGREGWLESMTATQSDRIAVFTSRPLRRQA